MEINGSIYGFFWADPFTGATYETGVQKEDLMLSAG